MAMAIALSLLVHCNILYLYKKLRKNIEIYISLVLLLFIFGLYEEKTKTLAGEHFRIIYTYNFMNCNRPSDKTTTTAHH